MSKLLLEELKQLETELKQLKKQLFVENTHLSYFPSEFIEMYHEDQLGNLIRNVDVWIKDIFKDLLENQ